MIHTPNKKMRRALATACFLILALDILTTWYALRIGASEGNPVQARLFEMHGFWLACALWMPLDFIRIAFVTAYPFRARSGQRARVLGLELSVPAVRILSVAAITTFAFHAFIVMHNGIVIDRMLGS